MSRDLTLAIYVFILATFVGFEVIARVPAILHTPLMSATNAIHGIVLLGAMLVAGYADTPLLQGLAFVAVVLGRRPDVVNPAAREDASSPIYGMPILDADKAKLCIVLKRGMAAGFAGIDNALFYRPNTRMLFGDAKKSLAKLVEAIKNV